MITPDMAKLESKLVKINAIRKLERELPGMSAFQRGQLSGAQQALYWVLGNGLEPVRAILTDEQITKAEKLAAQDAKYLD